MAIKKYTGELGKFSYDDTVFKLEDKGSDIEYLHYIGDEVDGKKIEIPYGIVNCFMMFANNENLEKAPPEIMSINPAIPLLELIASFNVIVFTPGTVVVNGQKKIQKKQ